MPKKTKTEPVLKQVEKPVVEEPKKLTAKEYIEQEYPALVRSPDNMPALLMAILTEIVKGRLEHE